MSTNEKRAVAIWWFLEMESRTTKEALINPLMKKRTTDDLISCLMFELSQDERSSEISLL
jgi:hypothetical protein